MHPEITVLISGRGSNMQSIHQACTDGILEANVTHVVSNNKDAAGLDYARHHGIKVSVVDHQQFAQRADFDTALIEVIEQHGSPDLVLLAGFMRRLTSVFTNQFEGKLINIHPSLLPKHPGLNTHSKAIAAGDTWHGCSVHFVNEALDGGPLIARGIVPVCKGDTELTLAARVLEVEHRIFPEIAQLFLHGGLACLDSHIILRDQRLQQPLLYYHNQ